MTRSRRISCGIAALALPGVALAQANPPLAPTREEVTRPPERERERPAPSQLQVEGELDRSPCVLANPEYKDIRFTLRNVEFGGLQDIGSASLLPAYSSLVGQDHPVSVICEIRDRAAAILRDAGYIASVEVPEQRIADGTVRFNVLMARLIQVRVRGDAGGAERTIAGYLNRLTTGAVFNRNQAERYLLLASDIPGYTVRLTLRPAGTQPGEVVGDVTVLHTPAYVDFNVQNWGSREAGRWGGTLRGQVFGLTGLGDRTTASLFTTADFKELQMLQLGHDFHLGPEGLVVYNSITYAWSHPSVESGDDIDAQTLFATSEVSYPFVRRQSHTIRGSVGMDIIDQDVQLEDLDLTRDRLRVAFARLHADADSLDTSGGYTSFEPRWRLGGTFEIRRGLDIFGATDRCGLECNDVDAVVPSRIEADGTATVVRASAYGEVRPLPNITFALGLRGQLASQPLLSFEEFAAGNYTVGRGYDPGSILGDRGFGAQAEVRLGSRLPKTAKAVATEAYGFFDYAKVSNRDHIAVLEGSNELSSTGAGVRVNYDRFELDVSVAVPLEAIGPLDVTPGPRVIVSLTSRLWPWTY